MTQLFTAQLVDGVDECDDILDRRFRQDAVAQIEDVPGRPPARSRIGLACARMNSGRAKSATGSRLPMTAIVADALAMLRPDRRASPDQTVASGLAHQFEQRRRARAEMYDGRARRDALNHASCVRQNVFAIIVRAESSRPTNRKAVRPARPRRSARSDNARARAQISDIIACHAPLSVYIKRFVCR